MVVHKRKKSIKFRGSKSHGWGSKKKHRGSGNRGGKGLAGTGKRAAQKKPTLWNLYGSGYLGKHGFTPHGKPNKEKAINTINLINIDEYKDGWVKKGVAELKEGAYIIDLKKLGYTKLLAEGKATK